MARPAALALSLGLVTSLAASALSGTFGASIGSVSDERRLGITPLSSAFSIWGPIYLLLAVAALHAAAAPEADVAAVAPALCLAAAEVLSGVWVPLFVANTRGSLVAASAVLVAAAACGVAAVALVGPLQVRGATPWQRLVAVQVAFALFAGWLLCAATLGVGIALQATQVAADTPKWTLLVLAATAGTAAAATRNPVLALPCAWALAWQPGGVGGVELLGMALCAVGGVGAVLR